MKRLLLFLILVGTGLTASAMGHPHNLFSAHRKAMQHRPNRDHSRTVCHYTRPAWIRYIHTALAS